MQRISVLGLLRCAGPEILASPVLRAGFRCGNIIEMIEILDCKATDCNV